MNTTRPLTPFLVSLLLVFGALGSASVARAQNTTTAAPSPAELRSALLGNVAAQLLAHFRTDGDLQLESLRPLSLPATDHSPTVEIVEFPPALTPSMLVRIRTGSDETSVQTLVVRAQLLREVWATRQPVEREAGVDISQLDTRRVDMLRERDAIPVTENCSEHHFSRAVPANRILSWRDVSRRPLVRKGQVIEVAAVDGQLSITLKALAMENGAAGETVKVRNLDSKKEFNALVVADSRALVRF
jgi:flagella basal body P-ring formation protein FlgA